MGILKIGLCGANGRMGQAIQESIIQKADKYELNSMLNRSHTENDLAQFCHQSDVIIDFSNASILKSLAEEAMNSKTPLVVGTTGLQAEHFEYLKELSKHVAVLYAANTSLGANLVTMLSAKAAKILKGYDIEIIESHHKHKKDAPSGTALMMGEKIAEALEVDFNKVAIFDRASKGERLPGEIGFSSIRAGGISGENEVLFADENELITLSYRSLSRRAYADGALFVANWLRDKKPALYSMQDVLSL
ncbi:MAG: 4-hydroxy-tetrahydrodipicolinate reductase [Rickettsiaceae bacterium]|nr:4-hydroxy-tetrahydrodipicolinate reductase [Rickettsiaceae bacterium]